MSTRSSLSDKTAIGVAWVTGQSLAAKVISYFAQLALAWFLTQGDYGLFGLASTIAAFGAVLNQGGVAKILIHRQSSFDKWSTPGLWLSICFGLLVTTVMLVAGFIGGYWWPGLFPLVAILAILPLFTAIGSVPKALLQSRLQFRTLATVNTAILLATSLLKILLAYLGCGAFSFVIPPALMAPIQAGMYWYLAQPKIKSGFGLRRWKYMINDSLMIVLTTLWYTLITHGDYVVLASLADKNELGLYFFAFNYAVQAIILFTQGVASVSFPALAGLKGQPERQVSAFAKAARMLATIVFPVCFLQAAVSEPLIGTYFPVIWKPAIPMLQVLSIGMAGRTISWLAASLMEAQGEFRKRMWLGLTSAIVFLIMAYLGARIGNAAGMATAVAVYYPFMAVATILVALSSSSLRNRISIITNTCLVPALTSSAAVGTGYVISKAVASDAISEIVLTCFLSLVCYVLLIRIGMYDVWQELWNRVYRMFNLFAEKRAERL